VLGEGEELVVAVALALFSCLSFLCFRLLWWCLFCCVDCHVVDSFGGRVEVGCKDVQGAQCLACRGGWRVLVSISAMLVVEDTPPICMLFST
jgi:hypothetical protein